MNEKEVKIAFQKQKSTETTVILLRLWRLTAGEKRIQLDLKISDYEGVLAVCNRMMSYIPVDTSSWMCIIKPRHEHSVRIRTGCLLHFKSIAAPAEA